jgi:hypothetical protein
MKKTMFSFFYRKIHNSVKETMVKYEQNSLKNLILFHQKLKTFLLQVLLQEKGQE